MMAAGMYCSLNVMGSVGLVLSTTISGGVGVILGLVTSLMEEGIPESGLGMIILIAAIYILAGFVSAYASKCRDIDHGIKEAKTVITGKILFLMLLSALLTNGWSMGTAAGTARGIPPVLTCALMASGSFCGALLIGIVIFSAKKQWKQVLCIGSSKKPILMTSICAVCHYGGNLISIYSMPAISATISFLLGRTSNLWTIFWGIYYKEFSNISSRTKKILALAIALFLIGTLLVALRNAGVTF